MRLQTVYLILIKILIYFAQTILLFRISFVGEIGYELHTSSDDAGAIYDVIMEEVQKYGGCDAGYRSLESLSTEVGK